MLLLEVLVRTVLLLVIAGLVLGVIALLVTKDGRT